jgi:hypothetical protein
MSSCGSIPGISNVCAPNITPSTLNSVLIPTFLQGMTQTQQKVFINASTQAASLFRSQALRFLSSIKNSQKQLSQKRLTCPFKVPWSVSSAPLNVNQYAQVNYLNFFMGNRTGFAYILGEVLSFFRKQKRCNQMIANGQGTCAC